MNNDNNDKPKDVIYPSKSFTAIVVALIGLAATWLTLTISNPVDDKNRFYSWQGDDLRKEIKRNREAHNGYDRKFTTVSELIRVLEDEVDSYRFEAAALRNDLEECHERYKKVERQIEKIHNEEDLLHDKVYEFQAFQHQQNKYLEKEITECKQELKEK